MELDGHWMAKEWEDGWGRFCEFFFFSGFDQGLLGNLL